MRSELMKASDALDQAAEHVAETKRRMDPDHKHRDDIEEIELGLNWIKKRVARILKEVP
jgi:hypothetical protein